MTALARTGLSEAGVWAIARKRRPHESQSLSMSLKVRTCVPRVMVAAADAGSGRKNIGVWLAQKAVCLRLVKFGHLAWQSFRSLGQTRVLTNAESLCGRKRLNLARLSINLSSFLVRYYVGRLRCGMCLMVDMRIDERRKLTLQGNFGPLTFKLNLPARSRPGVQFHHSSI